MSGLEDVYIRLPPWLQHAGCSVAGLHTQLSRYDRHFDAVLRESDSRTYVSSPEIVRFRDDRLRAFVEHAYVTSPFYRRAFDALGVQPSDINAIADLTALSLLGKETVRTNVADIASRAGSARGHKTIHTSGTTGGGLRFSTTRQAIQEQWATWWRYRKWHGIQPGTWCALFAGRTIVPARQTRPPFWRYNLPGRQILFSAYHASPDNMSYYLAELRRRKPRWLHGYPSQLAIIAGGLLDRGGDLGYRPQWVTTGAENLLPHQADLMERAFGPRPRSHYGLAEGTANISECDHGAFHVDEDFAAVEFVPTAEGNFRVVGTNLSNPATPLIRYDSDDRVSIDPQATCACGRPGRVVVAIDGRQEDYVMLRNGVRVGRLDHIFKDMVLIREAQIRQEKIGEIVVLVVPGEGYGKTDETVLLEEIAKRLGNDTGVSIEYMKSLERTRAGKLRFVVSSLRT
jgi:phenylacetate-CoA ligase